MNNELNYSIEQGVSYSWNGDFLHSVVREITKKNEEIISETVCEHFGIDLSTLREYAGIKQNGGYLYLCCEENYNSLAGEEGAISEISISKNVHAALYWFIERLKNVDNTKGAMFDEEEEVYRHYKNSLIPACNRFYKEIEHSKQVRTIVFFDKQENFDCYYEIVVRKVKVF